MAASLSSYFHVCFLILVLSLLSENLEQANAVPNVGEDRNSSIVIKMIGLNAMPKV